MNPVTEPAAAAPSESEYLRQVTATLGQIELALERAGVDADCALAGLVLTIELEDGARIVANAQAPMRQLWLAARSGAMHYALQGALWRDTRSGEEFFAALSRVVSQQLGRAVRLAPA